MKNVIQTGPLSLFDLCFILATILALDFSYESIRIPLTTTIYELQTPLLLFVEIPAWYRCSARSCFFGKAAHI